MNKKFYITTTLPYVNAEPHVGFALEIIQADVIARYHVSLGEEVFFNTGTDDHGQKIYQGAVAENKDPQIYTNEYAAKFHLLKEKLNLSYNNFIRTTDPHHLAAAQEFWKKCEAAGDIYKANYKMKYCVGCELEKQESELVEGCCPIHPNLKIEIREEENYFFKFSKYENLLLALYEKNPDFVIPAHRQKEIENFVKEGLKDFSISRLKEKMPWGIPVPGDENHIMYVWFDALINYISCLGWPEDNTKFNEFWGTSDNPRALQVAGKDNLRQQSAIWQAMLMSAGLPSSKKIFIHGFITSGGQKMSKSLGNVIDPFEVKEKFGTDGLRYFLLREIPPAEDGDFTWEKLEARYNADLANSLGNLVSRVTNIAEKAELSFLGQAVSKIEIDQELENFQFDLALEKIWQKIYEANKFIDDEKPWAIEDSAKVESVIQKLLGEIKMIGEVIAPFMPETAEKIAKIFTSGKITKAEPLFPRKN